MIPLLLVEILDSLVRLQFLDTACKLLTSQCFHHIVWKIQPVPWDKVGMTCAIWTTKFAQNSRATTTWTLRNSEGDLPRTMWCNTANAMLVQCEAVDYCPGAKASRGKTSTLLLAFLKWTKPVLSSTHICLADTGRSSSWFLICFIFHPLRSTILPLFDSPGNLPHVYNQPLCIVKLVLVSPFECATDLATTASENSETGKVSLCTC